MTTATSTTLFRSSATDHGVKIDFAPLEMHQGPISMLRKGFLDALGRGDFTFVASTSVHFGTAEDPILQKLWKVMPDVECVRVIVNAKNYRMFDMLMRGDDWWGLIDGGTGYASFEIGASDLERATEICRILEEAFDTRAVPVDVTNVRVVTQEDTTSCSYRDVAWSEVADNYPASTRTAMGELISLSSTEVRGAGGRIVVLHGPPGTGKTWAVRALLSTWREWAEGAVVLDPEVLFEDPMYMLRVSNSGAGKSSRVIVIEDADQIVERHGTRPMSISRLLNITDGVVGASNDSLLLLTTNAAPAELDRALLRPGRCLATVEFSPFDVSAARQRLGVEHEVNEPLTIAEIYQRLGTTIKIESEFESFSFGMYL